MSETTSERKDNQAFVEDGSESDKDQNKLKAKDHPLKTVPSNASANSASKRTSKTPKVHQDENIDAEKQKSARTEKPTSDKPVTPRKSKQAPASDPGSSKQPSTKRSQPKRTVRTRSPEKGPSRGDSSRNTDREHKRGEADSKIPCRCRDCLLRYYGQRPGPAPLQQGYHAYTQPHPGYPPHGPPPPHVMRPPQHPAAGIDPRRNSYYPGMLPGHIPGGPHLPVYPQMPPTLPRGQDPRYPLSHSMAPPQLNTRSLPTRTRSPVRASFDQMENYSTRISNPQYAPRRPDEIEDDSPIQAYEDESPFSTRHIPQSRRIHGQYESSEDYSDSAPESPPSVSPVMSNHEYRQRYPPAPAPIPARRESVHARSRSDLTRHRFPEQYREPRLEYDQDYFDYDYRSSGRLEPSYEDYDRDPPPHVQIPRRPSMRRRESISSGRTHSTFYSNPEYQYNRRDSYSSRPRYANAEEAAMNYQARSRGGPEDHTTAESLQHMRNSGSRSNISHHSRASMSETSSRPRNGSVRVLLPITAAEGATIELSGDGPERFSIKATEDRNQVELTISGGREYKYHTSNTSAGRSAVPTRSSGSIRQTTRSWAESSEVRREREARRLSRAGSSRKGTI